MTTLVRPSLPSDLDAIADILNEGPGASLKTTGEALQIWDERRAPEIILKRWVACEGTQVLGQAILTQDRTFFNPRQFTINLSVRRSVERRGIGTALYDAALAALTRLPVELIKCPVNEESDAGLRFLTQRGFVEKYRLFQSLLNLAEHPPIDLTSITKTLEHSGIQIKSLKEVRQTLPDHAPKIYALIEQVDRDVPLPDEHAPQGPERFWQTIERELPQGEPFFVAIKDGEYMGTHFGRLSADKKQLQVCQTGIRRGVRKHGLATALKLWGLHYAQSKNLESVSTWSDSRNVAMLALNQKLGFIRRPATLICQKTF